MTLPLEVVAAQLLKAAHCAMRGDADAIKAHVQQTVALLGASSSSSGKRKSSALPTWRANRVLAYIEDNLADRIQVNDLARQAGLSHAHLMRSFKVRFGVTIRIYITCRRLVTAQHQMMMTNEPLCEIALRCGMYDQAHFSRVFRRFVGLSPSRWRESQPDAPCGSVAPSPGMTANLLAMALTDARNRDKGISNDG
jgi:AraC family transcriptional regulator